MSELSDSNRAAVLDLASRNARAQLAPFLIVYKPQLTKLLPRLPSYVADAIGNLQTAIERWGEDETRALADEKEKLSV